MAITDVPCETEGEENIGLLPCSGACNVGMLTTRTTVDMANQYDNINFVCSLGIPIGIKGIVDTAKKSDYYIALNGCKVGCSTKALESIEIEPNYEVIVTEDLDIKKNKNYSDNSRLDKLNDKIEKIIENILV